MWSVCAACRLGIPQLKSRGDALLSRALACDACLVVPLSVPSWTTAQTGTWPYRRARDSPVSCAVTCPRCALARSAVPNVLDQRRWHCLRFPTASKAQGHEHGCSTAYTPLLLSPFEPCTLLSISCQVDFPLVLDIVSAGFASRAHMLGRQRRRTKRRSPSLKRECGRAGG